MTGFKGRFTTKEIGAMCLCLMLVVAFLNVTLVTYSPYDCEKVRQMRNGQVAHAVGLTFEKFMQSNFHCQVPVVIVDAMEEWPARDVWTPHYFADVLWNRVIDLDIGMVEQQDGNPATEDQIPMREFVEWLNYHNTTAKTKAYKERHGGLPYYAEDLDLIGPHTSKLWSDVKGLDYFPSDLFKVQTAFWMGPPGAKTGLHADPDPINILFQFRGTKRVELWHPSQEPKLCVSDVYDRGARVSKFDPDEERANGFQRCPEMATASSYTVMLYPGEALYVPQYWWHTVETMDEGPSISLGGRAVYFGQWLASWPLKALGILHHLGLYKNGRCTCHNGK